MAKIVKSYRYLKVVGDDGEDIIDRQYSLNINCSYGDPISVTVRFWADPEDFDTDEWELKEKEFEVKDNG